MENLMNILLKCMIELETPIIIIILGNLPILKLPDQEWESKSVKRFLGPSW